MQTPQVLQIPTLTPLGLSDLCTRYLQTRFQIELDERSSPQIGASRFPPDYPLMLPVPLASELDQIAFTLADAFLNRGKHSISLVDKGILSSCLSETTNTHYDSENRMGRFALCRQAPKCCDKSGDQGCHSERRVHTTAISSAEGPWDLEALHYL